MAYWLNYPFNAEIQTKIEMKITLNKQSSDFSS